MAARQFLKQVEGKILLGNRFIEPIASTRSSLFNPKDNSLVSDQHPICGKEDVENVVSTARKAFQGEWSKFSGAQRGDILASWADAIDKNHEEAAYYESLVSGRVMSQLLYEVPWIARVIRYYAGWCDKMEGDSLTDDDGFYKVVRHEPLGVCAGITPWNGPLMVLALKAAPALATGNTFILKPPEVSPLSSLYAGSLLAQTGIPDGVFNIITGDGRTGAMLASHMDIDKVSFTGSVPTGKKISAAANESNMKRVTLELGGKSAALVFDDADLPAAIANLSQGITMNAGQVCVASSRVFVHENIADEFIAGVKKEFQRITDSIGGDPQDPSTTFGPLATKVQYDRVNSFIEQGKKEGSEIIQGGGKHESAGNYIPPTIFKNPGPGASVYEEEIFGPVLCVQTFTDEAEAIRLANNTQFGLAAYCWTKDIKRAFRVGKALQAGSVGINAGVALFPNAPFGGYKASGVGKELGRYALKYYTNTKTMYINTGH